MGLVTGDSTTRLDMPRYESAGEDEDWQRLERTTSPEEEKSGEEYEREYGGRGHDGGGVLPGKEAKDWEGHGPPPGGAGAFI